MKKYLIVLFLFLLSAQAFAQDRVTLSGYIKNETAMRVENLNGDLQKFKNILQLAGEYKIKDDTLVFFTKMRYWYDAAYDFREKLDPAHHYMTHVQRTDWLRDCYLDYVSDKWFLRMGKQQVAWGQADGITILDRVNPFDLSEYWLQDMEDLRIPLWMANINYSPKVSSNIQLLIIPDFEQSTSAAYGAPFTTYSYIRYMNWKKSQTSVNENIYYPGKQFENSTFGLQWSDRFWDIDYTFNFLSGYYYSARNQTMFLGGGLNWKVDRSFKRYRMYGASFNKTMTEPGLLQGYTFRGDFAYYDDEPTYWGDPVLGSASGIKRMDNIFWLIGADKYVITRLLLSVQYAQTILHQSKPGATTAQKNYFLNPFTYGPLDPIDNIFTIKLSTWFKNERIRPEVLWSFTDDGQGRVAPKINFELKDNLVWTIGANYFYGNEWDSNGQYRDQSQVFSNLKLSF